MIGNSRRSDESPPRHLQWIGPLSWLATAIATLTAVFFGWLILRNIKDQSSREIASTLSAVLHTSEEAMRQLVVGYKEDAETWATTAEVIKHAKQLRLEPEDREHLLASPSQQALRELIRPFLEKRGYLGIFLIAPDNISLASMRDSNVGSTNLLAEQIDFLKNVSAGQVLLSRPIDSDVPLPDAKGRLIGGQPTMFVAAPVRETDGSLIAVLTFRIVPSRDFSRIAKMGRVGSTGSTYGLDRNGKMLTESLFSEQLRKIGLLGPDQSELLSLEIRDPGGNITRGFLPVIPRAEQPLTRMAAAAVAGASGFDVDGYRDYRGVNVVGAWVWDDQLSFAMATEMDYNEAYRRYHATRRLVLVGLFLIVTLFVSLSAILSTDRTRALRLANQMTVALRESEHRYRSLVQTAGNVIVYLSPDYHILEFNNEAERVHQMKRELLLGKNYFDLFVPESSRELFADAARSAPGNLKHVSFECSIRTANGAHPILLWNLTVLQDDHGHSVGIIAVGQDITEHKQAEERALLAERLAAIGQVSSGLAHESRNALARSKACLEMLSRRVQDRPEAIDLIDRIQIAQRQLLKLYEQVREYATPIMLERSPSDLNDILKLAWDHLESEKQDKNIQLNLRTGDLDVACYIDPFAMEQVFRNVLENGISACGTHGVITVSWIDTTIQSVPAIRISISNDGPPLVLEEQERIFEAFFTKKTRGSGLGMAITKRLVEAHGGLVEVSQPDKGVEILITLPRGLT